MPVDFNQLLERLSVAATRGALVLPIGAAVFIVFVVMVRKKVMAAVLRVLGVKDATLEKTILKKVDGPLVGLLLALAIVPFAALLEPALSGWALLALHLVSIVLLFHIIIQATDLALFSWYLNQRQATVSAVVRFSALGLMYAVASLLVLDWGLGVSVLPLLATSTVVAAVLGLALQDTLRNVFAGLNMSLEQSFIEGDWVMFRLDATTSWYGQIVEIGWRTTKIRTLNNNFAVIPNATFTMHELVNFNRPTERHARTIEVPVKLSASRVDVEKALIDAAAATAGVIAEPAPAAIPLAIKSDHVQYQLRFWMDTPETREDVTGAVTGNAWQALAKTGALVAWLDDGGKIGAEKREEL